MSKVRVLVGTRKGAFVLTSDGKRDKWEVSGPHFAGWEMYHVKGSPVDPNRLYASQSSSCTLAPEKITSALALRWDAWAVLSLWVRVSAILTGRIRAPPHGSRHFIPT